MCGGGCFCRAPPSACILIFALKLDVFAWGVGVFLSANDSAQVKLGVDKMNNWMPFKLEKIAHVHIAAKKKKHGPSEPQ